MRRRLAQASGSPTPDGRPAPGLRTRLLGVGSQVLILTPLLVVAAALGPSTPEPDAPRSADLALDGLPPAATDDAPWWDPFAPGLALAEGESPLGDVLALGEGTLGAALDADDLARDPLDLGSAPGVSGGAIPVPTLGAYRRAAARLAVADPSCGLEWTLLAGIGRVESNHGRHGGASVTAEGVSVPPVIGVRLDGSLPGTMVIRDTDGGSLDGDSAFDRAVGPMQFLPGTWRAYAADGDGDGRTNPQDIDDAALASAIYLCTGSADLSTPAGARSAVLRYNNSGDYADLVLSLASVYAGLPTTEPLLGPIEAPVQVGAAAPERPASPGLPLGVERPQAPSAPRGPGSGVLAQGPGSPQPQTPGRDGGQQRQPGTQRPSPGSTPGPTPQPTRLTPTATSSPTGTPTATLSPTATATPTPTGTATTSPTPTAAPTGTPTASPTGTPTSTATPTATPTGTPTATPTCSPQPSETASPSGEPTSSPAPTSTPSPEPSAQPTSEPTSAPSGEPTATGTPTCPPDPDVQAAPPAAGPGAGAQDAAPAGDGSEGTTDTDGASIAAGVAPGVRQRLLARGDGPALD